MSAHERQMRITDIGFQVATGRSNPEAEQAAMKVLGLDALNGFAFVLKQSSDRKVLKVWRALCEGRSVMGF